MAHIYALLRAVWDGEFQKEERHMATKPQFAALVNLLTRALSTVIERLPDIGETIKRAEADEEALADGLVSLLLSLSGEARPTPPEAHAAPEATVLTVEVFCEFELDGEAYDAAAVKWTGETPPTLEQAIKAADTDSYPVVRSETGWSRAYERRQKLPEKLNGLSIFTARPRPDCPRRVSCLDRDSLVWYEGWSDLVSQWDDDCLVLRHRT